METSDTYGYYLQLKKILPCVLYFIHITTVYDTSGANVKKLLTSVNYEFLRLASICPWQALRALSNKHSSLVRKLVNYGQKSFITLGPGVVSK